MTIRKKGEGHNKPSQTIRELSEDTNLSTSKKLLRFSPKVNNNNRNYGIKKSKTLECNCWVCRLLLDSSTSAAVATNLTATTTTKRYEPYNIVSETRNSILYDPLISNGIFDDDEKDYNNNKLRREGQVFVSETAIEEVVNRIIDDKQQRLGSSINNNNKNDY